ncbi:unnamed protein product [Rhizophagus irregularis]|nr:unnamed protein product [Rhizophagus irregularis]CAB4442842.1 unnamed protein product [Rhizophagus irregularis]
MWSAKSLRANIISKGGRRLSDSDGIRVMFDTAPKRTILLRDVKKEHESGTSSSKDIGEKYGDGLNEFLHDCHDYTMKWIAIRQ